MAFLIPDNLKSRNDVSAPIRRVADAFQIGLDESATLWYEPPYDPDGGRPHFVLFVPDRGIIVFEVLTSDSKSTLGAIRGKIRLTVDGAETTTDSPITRAKALATVLSERLGAEDRLAGVQVAVAAGAVLSGLNRAQAEGAKLEKVLDLDLCIYSDEIASAVKGDGEAILRRAVVRMLGGAECDLSAEQQSIVRGVINPDIVIDGALERPDRLELRIVAPSEAGDVIRVMDRQQEAMAKSLGGGHRVIRGVAGSGKTLLLVYRAGLLARYQPTKTFLVTCYTRTLASQLRHMLVATPSVDVVNIDRLMAQMIKEADIEHPGYGDGGAAVWEAALAVLKRRECPGYDGVFVDEAQDFTTEMLQFAVGLLNDPVEGDLMVVADGAQNIFRRQFRWRDVGIQAQGRTRILRTNYRNTKQILEFAHLVLLSGGELSQSASPDPDDANEVISPEAAMREGDVPAVLFVDNSEVDAVVQQVTTWRKQAPGEKEIAVLYSSSDAANPAKIRDALKASGADVFWMTDPADPTARDRLAEAHAEVVLSTIHSAKGLEFACVVLCGIWREDEDESVNRKLAYVGMTRARDHLAVVHPSDGPLADVLRDAMR